MKIKKYKMNYGRKITAIALAGMLCAASCVKPVLAAGENVAKEEVVYINLNGDGTVKETNVVNIFQLEQDGTIVDYGAYDDLHNMTTTDEILYQDDKVTIDGKAGSIYYEGKMKENVIPWNISIKYFMDGTEYSPDEITGKSGSLKIEVSITENEESHSEFFEQYALQATLLLDTNLCKNIVAEEATIANVGSDKQLTYMILPGNGTEFVITAEAEAFECDGFSINGIPLNLDIEVEDEALMEQVTLLTDAIGQLRDGGEELHEGTKELVIGGTDLKDGAGKLNQGVKALDSGVSELNDGIEQIQSGLDALNKQSGDLTDGSKQMKLALEQLKNALGSVSASTEEVTKLVEASSMMKAGIDKIVTGANQLQAGVSFEAYKSVMKESGLDIDEVVKGNTSVIDTLDGLLAQIESIEQALKDYQKQLPEEYQEKISEEMLASMSEMKTKCTEMVKQLKLLPQGNNGAISGMEQYLNGVSGGIEELAKGAKELQSSYVEFDKAIGTLAKTLTNMVFQMTELKNAVNTLVTEYGKLDQGVNAYTKGVAQVITGYDEMANGAKSLAKGSKALKSGSSELYNGSKELVSGMEVLEEGTETMKNGTGELFTKTDGMDDMITEQIDELLESISGGEGEAESFVSEKNTNVKAVQFVMQTDGIHADEAEATVKEAEDEPTFWQRLLRLFGME